MRHEGATSRPSTQSMDLRESRAVTDAALETDDLVREERESDACGRLGLP